jgi:hypothetical protein
LFRPQKKKNSLILNLDISLLNIFFLLLCFSSSFRVYSFVVSSEILKRRWKKAQEEKNPRLRIGIIYKRDVKLHRFNQFLKVFRNHQIVNKFLYFTTASSTLKTFYWRKIIVKKNLCEERNILKINKSLKKDNFWVSRVRKKLINKWSSSWNLFKVKKVAEKYIKMHLPIFASIVVSISLFLFWFLLWEYFFGKMFCFWYFYTKGFLNFLKFNNIWKWNISN